MVQYRQSHTTVTTPYINSIKTYDTFKTRLAQQLHNPKYNGFSTFFVVFKKLSGREDDNREREM